MEGEPMNAQHLLMLALNASMFLVVFVLGLGATFQSVTYLFRHPALLLRSILSMNVIMLAFAILVCVWFQPPPAIRIALVGIAISPVPPILPNQQLGAGGASKYVFGLLVGTALSSIVIAPLAIELLDRWYGLNVHLPPAKVATMMFVSIVIPLILGILVNRFAPAFAARITKPVSMFANILLVVAALPMLVAVTPVLWPLVGNGVVAALVAFTIVGIAVGHFLGGPSEENRSVLALATGSRHPGIPLAIASINFPDQKDVIAVVLYHLIIGALVALPYVIRRKRLHAKEASAS
jgi:BASS family bile acid:Na+ symporter